MKNFDDSIVISHFLRGGSILSVIFIVTGVILLFIRNGETGLHCNRLQVTLIL